MSAVSVPSTVRRGATALVGLFVAVVALLPAVAAQAHSGGRAVVVVRDLALVADGPHWRAEVTLSDNDSGDPIRGSRVTAWVGKQAKQAKQVVLAPGATPGLFQGHLMDVEAGATTLGLRVRAAPGTEPVVPFDQTWPVQLVAGESTVLVGGSDGGGALPVVLGLLGAAVAVGTVIVLFRARRRTAVPAGRA